MPIKFLNAVLISGAFCAFMNPAQVTAATETSANTQVATHLGNDDDTFVFMGRCPSGTSYRLFAYDKQVNGVQKSFYDYQGPAGQGTVKTKTAPKVMVSRVCLALAEISDDE